MLVSWTVARRLFLLFLVALSLGGCSAFTQTMKASPTLLNAVGMIDMPMEDLKKRYTNQHSKWIEVGGLNIHYRDQGEGHPIVLIHGIMSSLHTWDGWVKELEKQYRVITLDVPGFGLTGAPPATEYEFSEETLMKIFAQFIDALELKRFSIAGNSLGGFMAATYAAHYPHRVERLILLDPIAYPQKTPWIFNVATLPGISTLGRLVTPPLLVTLNVRDVYGDPSRMTNEHLHRYIHMAQRPGAKSVYMDTMILLKNRSATGADIPFGNIQAPTLLMWGEQDRWVPVELTERWKQDVPNIKVIIYPGVGHVPMEEIPEQTVQDALAFLGDLGRSSVPTTKPSSSSSGFDELEFLIQGGDMSDMPAMDF